MAKEVSPELQSQIESYLKERQTGEVTRLSFFYKELFDRELKISCGACIEDSIIHIKKMIMKTNKMEFYKWVGGDLKCFLRLDGGKVFEVNSLTCSDALAKRIAGNVKYSHLVEKIKEEADVSETETGEASVNSDPTIEVGKPFIFSEDALSKIEGYYLNLKDSKERNKLSAKERKKTEINIKRYEATGPQDGKLGDLTPAELGCLVSHISALENSTADLVLILEDDFGLCENFDEKLLQAIKELPENFEILLLGGRIVGPNEEFSENLLKINGFTGTYGYLMARSFIPKAIAAMKKENKLADWAISEVLQNGLKTKENLVKHKDGFSIIKQKEVNYPDLV